MYAMAKVPFMLICHMVKHTAPEFLKDVAGDEIRQRNNKTSTDNLGVVMGVVFSALCSKTGGVSKFMEYGQL